MRFLQAKEADKAAVMELWAKDFEAYEPYYSWYFNTVYRSERTFTLQEGGKLLACAQLAPYLMRLHGQAFNIDFVVGVITQPELRGKGLGAKLMRELEQWQRQQGKLFSVLVAVCPEFYGKLGYCYCYEHTLWDTPVERLRPQGDFPGEWRLCGIDEALPALRELYAQSTAALNGFILRTEQNWRNFLTEIVNDKGQILIYSEDGAAKAYMLLLAKPEKDTEKLWLREMGCAEAKYKNACFAYIKEHYPADRQLYWAAPAADLSYLRLPLPDGIGRYAGAMVRCHDTKKALLARHYDCTAAFSIEIEDSFCEENSCKTLLRVSPEEISLSPCEGEAGIKMGIQPFTQLYWGFLSAGELYANGLLQCGEEKLALLDACFPKRSNWLSEQT